MRQFALPHVYHVGSHEGCGCGFIKEGEEGVELEIHQANYVALAGLIREAMARGASIELFACWEGDQGRKPEFVDSLLPSRLEDPAFQFKEKQFIRVNVETPNNAFHPTAQPLRRPVPSSLRSSAAGKGERWVGEG